jgi:hypothetical protein
MTDVPATLTLDEAYRAAFHLTDLWLSLEKQPCEGLILFHQYLQSDPARWDDWKASVRKALAGGGNDPLRDNIGPLD